MAEQDIMVRGGLPRLDDTVIGRALDWLTARHVRAVAALIIVSLLCFLPGLSSIAPVDRDEARFAQATKQMVETGNYVDIRLQAVPRYKKPIGIYWLQAAMVKLSGLGAGAPIGVYRLASVLGGVLAVLLTYWATLPLFGRRAGFIAGAALGLSVIVAVESHLATTDAVLLATVVLAQGALARIYLARAIPGKVGTTFPSGIAQEQRARADHRFSETMIRSGDGGRPGIGTALSFWLGLGLGMLVKGPVIVMVSGLTIAALVALDRRAGWLKDLRPLIGLPLAAAIVLPWLVAIVMVSGGTFFDKSIGGDLLGKVAAGAQGHGAPPGMHFLVFWFIYFPATALVPLAVPWVWRQRRAAPVRFALAWLVPSWLVFELVTTKLPHYTLPLYPAISALIGGAVVAGLPTGRLWTRLAAVPGAIYAVLVPLAGVAALAWFEGEAISLALAGTIVAAGLAVFVVRLSFRDAPLAATTLLGAAAVVVYASVFGAVLPRLDTFRVSARLADAVAAAGCSHPKVASAGYEEPSLIFLVGTDTELTDGSGAAEFLAKGGCRVALVDARQAAGFTAEAGRLGLVLDKRSTVDGINIGSLRRVDIGIYRAADKPAG